MKDRRIILIAFLVGITFFSVFKYITSLKEKSDLRLALNRIKEQVTVLENERQNLSQELEQEKQLQQQLNQENLGLKENLKVSEEKLVKLNADFSQVQNAVEQLNSGITALKAENTALKDQNDKLNIQLAEVAQEKDNLKARLSSITELKKAIRELKRQMHQVSGKIKVRGKIQKVIGGNGGFLIKDGKSTYPLRKVKIDVMPALPVDRPAPPTNN